MEPLSAKESVRSENLEGLSKSDIHAALGADYSDAAMKFCRECDRKGLIRWIKHLEHEYGDFPTAIEALAEKYPTTIEVVYSKQPRIEIDRFGRARRYHETLATPYEMPSVWSEWRRVLRYIPLELARLGLR
jgi:hypothetical protein